MINILLALALLSITFALVVIRKTYYFYPLYELRRQSQRGDEFANRIYGAVSFGDSLRSLLWSLITFGSALSFVLFSRQTSVLLSLFIVIAALWLSGSWLPNTRVTRTGAKLTFAITPAFIWILDYLNPILSRSSRLASKRYLDTHTGIFEREDLERLITKQQQQPDNRLELEELEIAGRALRFSDIKVSKIMSQHNDIRTIKADDTIGPILIDELHKSGQEAAFVRDKPKGEIIGLLEISKLNIHTSGLVRDAMDSNIYYVHQNDSLAEALHAQYLTNRPIFMVVDDDQKTVGVITIKLILEQLIGHIPGEDFDQYDNRALVATRHAEPISKQIISDNEVDAVIEL